MAQEQKRVAFSCNIDTHYPRNNFGQGLQELGFVRLIHESVHHGRFENDDRKTGKNSGKPELQRQQRVVPEVMQLIYRNEKEGAK